MIGAKLADTLTKQSLKTKNNFLFGKVIKKNPITIKIADLPDLSESNTANGRKQLIIGANCQAIKWHFDENDKLIWVNTDKEPIPNDIKELIKSTTTYNRGLEVGDDVFVIQSGNGQLFYVCERL